MQHLYGRTYLTSPRGQLGDYTYVGPLIQLPPRAYKKLDTSCHVHAAGVQAAFRCGRGVARG